MDKYYEAYDRRYREAHSLGLAWADQTATPIVREVIQRYGLGRGARMLELGCGEGRDAVALLRAGYDLLATDVSPEAIAWCRAALPECAARFRVLDCLRDELPERFDFLYAVAVLHMLVEDADRAAFCRFAARHLAPAGLGLICVMGDGVREFRTDPARAFDPVERQHPAGPLRVAATSCRVVGFGAFEAELRAAGLRLLETGLTASPPEFDSLMYAVVAAEGEQEEEPCN